MSKNLTRKGLALGAIVALGSSLFAGAPAFAAGTASTGVTLAPNAGTTYSTIAGSAFDLANTLQTGALVAQYGSTDAADKLSFLVTNAGAAKLNFKFNGTANLDYNYFSGTSAATVTTTGVATSDATDLSAKAIVIKKSSTDSVNTSLVATKNHLIINSKADIDANVVVGVTAFIDENGNGKIDTGDLVSETREVTFVPVANVVATTSVTSAVVGSKKIQATVVFGGGINAENIAANYVTVKVLGNGAALDGALATAVAANWDEDDEAFENSIASNNVTTAVSAVTYTAQAYVGADKLGSAGAAITGVVGTVTSVDAVDFLSVAGSANVVKTTNTAATGTTAAVRSGFAGDVTFKSTVGAGSTFATVKQAGVTVKVTITATKLATGSTFVAGGKTLSATAGTASFEVKSDADGKVSFTGAGTGKKDDEILVTINPLLTGGYDSTKAKTVSIKYTDAVATSFVSTSLVGASAVVKTTVGGSYNLSYVVADQFGQAVPTGTYRATLTSGSGTNANLTYLATGVAGKIAQTVVDNSTTTGTYAVTADLFKYNTTTLAWDAVALADVVTNVYVNAKVAATVSAEAAPTTSVATQTVALGAVDLRVDNNSQAAPAYASANKFTVTGNARDADGAGVAGAVVTVTGAGLGFVVNSNVYTIGSATVNAGVDGAYSLDVYSTTAGKTSVVVTSGAATKTVAIEFTGVTTLDAKGTIVIDAPALSQVGRSVTVGILVKDSLGNPVKSTDLISVSVTGVGSLSAAKVSTDATGKATVQFIAGANDFGDAVIVAKYTNSDDTVVSATKTLTVGITDAQVDIVGKRVTAVASFTKGKTVSFYVDGVKKWSKLSASDADVVLNYNLKKGTHTVTLKVSGGFVATEKFIVK